MEDPYWDERPPLTREEREREKKSLKRQGLWILMGLLLLAGYAAGQHMGWW